MKRIAYVLLAVGLFWTGQLRAESVAARPFLWRIDGPKPSYVFGSIHLPSKEVTQLAPPVEKALTEADAVYCELAFDAATITKIATAVQNPAKPLSQVLPADLYACADAALQRIAPTLRVKMFEKTEVWVLATQLMMLEEQLKAPTTPPLDLMIYQRAQAAGKQVGGIETAEEELQAMNSFAEAEQVDMLRATLDEMDAAQKLGQTCSGQLLSAYLSGDLDVVERYASKMMARYSPASRKRFEETLLAERNQRMADRIREKLRAAPGKSQLFVIGALHFTGKGNVLELLQQAGLKIERVSDRLKAQPISP